MIDRHVQVKLELDIEMTEALATALTEKLRDILITHVGDATDGDGWDAHTADLGALMARTFDRQESPISEMFAIINERDELAEDYAWFATSVPA